MPWNLKQHDRVCELSVAVRVVWQGEDCTLPLLTLLHQDTVYIQELYIQGNSAETYFTDVHVCVLVNENT